MASALGRIGLIGDIHAEDATLALALRILADAGADRIMAVGDIVDGRGSVDRCCALLAEAGALVVRGNHERWFLANTMRELPDATLAVGEETRRYLAALPKTLRFEVPGRDVLLCHGLGDDDMASVALDADGFSIRHNPPLAALIEDDRASWVLNGHTHRRGVWSYRRLTVINAGTLFGDHEPCFGLVDLAGAEVTFFEVLSSGRVGRKETVALPPPLGARR
ncbi:MAG: metallophosphoesterase family protein [Byssovorax sp.]